MKKEKKISITDEDVNKSYRFLLDLRAGYDEHFSCWGAIARCDITPEINKLLPEFSKIVNSSDESFFGFIRRCFLKRKLIRIAKKQNVKIYTRKEMMVIKILKDEKKEHLKDMRL